MLHNEQSIQTQVERIAESLLLIRVEAEVNAYPNCDPEVKKVLNEKIDQLIGNRIGQWASASWSRKNIHPTSVTNNQ